MARCRTPALGLKYEIVAVIVPEPCAGVVSTWIAKWPEPVALANRPLPPPTVKFAVSVETFLFFGSVLKQILSLVVLIENVSLPTPAPEA